jgi:hypothetical protein
MGQTTVQVLPPSFDASQLQSNSSGLMFLNTMRCRPWLPSGTRGLARQNHLSVSEFAGEIEVAAFVVHPGLLPFACPHVENGNASPSQMHGIAPREILLDDAAVQNSPILLVP